MEIAFHPPLASKSVRSTSIYFQTPVLGLGIGVDFIFTWDSNNNDNDKNNPHLNFLKGTVLRAKEQGLGITDKI